MDIVPGIEDMLIPSFGVGHLPSFYEVRLRQDLLGALVCGVTA